MLAQPHAALIIALSAALLSPLAAEAQGGRRPRAEVIAWSADATVVVMAERRAQGERGMDLVARRVPGGQVVARAPVFPGPCARVIDGRVAIVQACALASLRPRLPERYRGLQYYVAAQDRGRMFTISLSADGSTVEHELPGLGLVLRGRTGADGDGEVAILEVLGSSGASGAGRVLDRRPIRERSRRRWTLLQAGGDRFIVVGRGLLRRISPPRPTVARARPSQG